MSVHPRVVLMGTVRFTVFEEVTKTTCEDEDREWSDWDEG